MIAELKARVSTVSGDNGKGITNQKMLFPEPAAQVGRQSEVEPRNIKGTCVSRGPTEENRLISSPRIRWP
jgi:hypothetical protein